MNAIGKPDPFKAMMFAQIAHAGQTYNEEVPYTFHLQSVVNVLERFGITEPIFICAAWLHDCIEDTNKSYNDIKKRFGEEVAEIVYCVTSELGRNRKERNSKTYPKIRSNVNAIIIKIADRIANIEYGIATDGKNEMYKTEYKEFRDALYIKFPGHEELERMWKHLDQLLGWKL